MAATKPVDLCTHLFASGKLCRGVALRNERYCRAHIRDHRILDHQRVQHEALQRLSEQTDSMPLDDLLYLLLRKLEAVHLAHSLRQFPEVSVLLVCTINRVIEAREQTSDQMPDQMTAQMADPTAQLTSPESIAAPQLSPDQTLPDLAQLHPSQLNQMLTKYLESIA